MEIVDVVLVAGAAARLTRLTTRDKITQPLRNRLQPLVLFTAAQRRALDRGEPLPAPIRRWEAQLRVGAAGGLRCDWCVGLWWSALIALGAALWGDRAGFQVPALALTAAYVLGWVVEHERPAVEDTAEDGP